MLKLLTNANTEVQRRRLFQLWCLFCWWNFENVIGDGR